jgi:hypothetical protein
VEVSAVAEDLAVVAVVALVEVVPEEAGKKSPGTIKKYERKTP